MKQSSQERQHTIKQEILGSDEEGDDDDIILIDDEFDDDYDVDLEASIELADTTVVDDLFGEDTLLNDFKKNNEIFYNANKDDEIINCPLCLEKMARETLEIHLDGCSGVTVTVTPKNFGKLIQKAVPTSFITLPSVAKANSRNHNSSIKKNNPPSTFTNQRPTTSNSSAISTPSTSTSKKTNSNKFSIPLSKTSVAEELTLCGYSEEEIQKVMKDMESTSEAGSENIKKRPCPICNMEIDINLMNEHLDDCLLID